MTARSPDVRVASRRFDEALLAARREGRGAPGSRWRWAPVPSDHLRNGSPRAAAALHPALPLASSEAAPAHAAALADLGSGLSPTSPASVALRAAVRALPPVIEAARLQDGARLVLTLGGALGVELRGGAAGVEVTLRPAAALGQAAAAELPALVAALRARGVRVTRAELGSGPRRPHAAPGGKAR